MTGTKTYVLSRRPSPDVDTLLTFLARHKFSSNRRLPSRLFSSTRRLFGTGATSAPSPAISTPIRSHSVSSSQTFSTGFPTPVDRISQQQRLAEFATVLGDIKLATTVWEALRKDGKGGSVRIFLFLSCPRIRP